MRFVVALRRASPRVLLLALLAGCAGLPPTAPILAPAGLPGKALTVFNMNGRIGARYDGKGFYGNVRWRHDAAGDEVWLLSPLGQTVAQLTRGAGGVDLLTSDQRRFHAADAETLTEDVLGWRLPLQGLAYWVQGRPAPGDGAEAREAAADGGVRLRQAGWTIELDKFSVVDGASLPGVVSLRRDGLEVKLAVERWQVGRE